MPGEHALKEEEATKKSVMEKSWSPKRSTRCQRSSLKEEAIKREEAASKEPNFLVNLAMVLSTNPTITPFLSLLPSLTFARFHQNL